MMSAWHKKISLECRNLARLNKIYSKSLYRLWGKFKVNCYDFDEFRKSIRSLDEEQIKTLLKVLESKENEKDKADKIRLLNLELERKYKLRKYHGN